MSTKILVDITNTILRSLQTLQYNPHNHSGERGDCNCCVHKKKLEIKSQIKIGLIYYCKTFKQTKNFHIFFDILGNEQNASILVV